MKPPISWRACVRPTQRHEPGTSESAIECTQGDSATERWLAIEEFASESALDAFVAAQTADAEAQTTIAKTFAPIGPITALGYEKVTEFPLL